MEDEDENYQDSITLIYKIFESRRIKIFGNIFVEKNKKYCEMEINGQRLQISEYIDLDTINYVGNGSDLLEIKLYGINKLHDLYDMFNICRNLYQLPDLDKWDISEVYNMRCMFGSCSLLTQLPDISGWNTSNVTDMSFLFSTFFLLIFFLDILI